MPLLTMGFVSKWIRINPPEYTWFHQEPRSR